MQKTFALFAIWHNLNAIWQIQRHYLMALMILMESSARVWNPPSRFTRPLPCRPWWR